MTEFVNRAWTCRKCNASGVVQVDLNSKLLQELDKFLEQHRIVSPACLACIGDIAITIAQSK